MVNHDIFVDVIGAWWGGCWPVRKSDELGKPQKCKRLSGRAIATFIELRGLAQHAPPRASWWQPLDLNQLLENN